MSLCYLFLVAYLGAPEQQVQVAEQLRQHLTILEKEHPDIKVADQRIRVAEARVGQAGNLPDPQLKAGVFLEPVETRVGPQNFKLGLSQKLPLAKKWAARRKHARLQVDTQVAQRNALVLDLETQFLNHFADWSYLQRTLQIHEEHLQLLRSLEEVSGERYRISKARYQDLINIQIEIDRVQDLIHSIHLALPQHQSALNHLLGRAPETPIALPSHLPALPDDRANLPSDISQLHPKLLPFDSRMDQSRSDLSLAKLDAMPDVTLGLEWIGTGRSNMPVTGNGDDPVVLSVGVNLPIWKDQRKAKERAAALTHQSVEQEQIAMRRALENQLAQASFQYQDALRKTRLYGEQVLPKARESLEVTLVAFQNATASFSEVIDAEEALLNFQLTVEQARTDQFKAWVAIRAASGTKSQEVL